MNYSKITIPVSFSVLDGTTLQISDESAEALVTELGEGYECQKVNITNGSVQIFNNTSTSFVGFSVNVIKHNGAKFGFALLAKSGITNFLVCIVDSSGRIRDNVRASGSAGGYTPTSYSGNSKTISFYRCFDFSLLFSVGTNSVVFSYISDYCYSYVDSQSNSIAIQYWNNAEIANASLMLGSNAYSLLNDTDKIAMYKVPHLRNMNFDMNIYTVVVQPSQFVANNTKCYPFVLDNSVYMFISSLVSYYWMIAIKIGDL